MVLFCSAAALVEPGATGVTRVLSSNVGIIKRSGKNIEDLQVMGIDPPTFGPVVWIKNDLLTRHLYEYLNAMSSQEEGILISRNLQAEFGLKLGELMIYKYGDTNARGIICGIVDYWPGCTPIQYAENADSSYSKMPNYLVVANIDYLNGNAWDLRPYEVWIGALDEPTEGTVFFGGTELTGLDEGKCTRLRRMQIGLVFQSVALIPMMSALENVEYALRLTRYKGDRTARAHRLRGCEDRCLHSGYVPGYQPRHRADGGHRNPRPQHFPEGGPCGLHPGR